MWLNLQMSSNVFATTVSGHLYGSPTTSCWLSESSGSRHLVTCALIDLNIIRSFSLFLFWVSLLLLPPLLLNRKKLNTKLCLTNGSNNYNCFTKILPVKFHILQTWPKIPFPNPSVLYQTFPAPGLYSKRRNRITL